MNPRKAKKNNQPTQLTTPRNTRRGGVGARLLLWSLGFLLSVAYLTVDVLFSPFDLGGERVVIPDFCGGDAALAEGYGWLDVTVEYRNDEAHPAGTVISQVPPAGVGRKLTKERPQCPLTLYVSLGRATAILPDVVGKTEHEAVAELRGVGASVTVERKESPYPEGTVYEMTPDSGETVPLGSAVRIKVSAGAARREISMPDLIGRQRAEALVELWMAGLSVEEIIEEGSFLPEGEVVRQSPPPGTLLPMGSGVRLYVSRGWGTEDLP